MATPCTSQAAACKGAPCTRSVLGPGPTVPCPHASSFGALSKDVDGCLGVVPMQNAHAKAQDLSVGQQWGSGPAGSAGTSSAAACVPAPLLKHEHRCVCLPGQGCPSSAATGMRACASAPWCATCPPQTRRQTRLPAGCGECAAPACAARPHSSSRTCRCSA